MLKQSHAIFEDLVHWRRDFHMHPELGFTEHRTSKIVADELEKMGYRVRRGVGRTGVVADIGDDTGPTIAIRADMDALPILESADREYASENPGIMHACGHDSHTSMALGAALVLSKENFKGRIRFLFQPSEEAGDAEGISGAPRMIADGALEGVNFVLAQHVDPQSPVGTIRIGAGPVSGGVDSWEAKIIGKGAHGAHPNESVDPFHILGHIIVALNGIVSRRLDPFVPAVVSIGAIKGGFTHNVIPEEVEMIGTLRFTDNKIYSKIKVEMERAFSIARAYGGDYVLNFLGSCPPMINHESAAELIRKSGSAVLGAGKVLPAIPTLGAEDFGAFTEKVPGAMYTLGTLIEGDERFLHHPRFDIDERAMPIGTAVLVETALQYLKQSQ